MASGAAPVALASSSGALRATTKAGVFHGLTIAESAGTPAAAHVRIRQGGSSGPIIADIALVASGSLNPPFWSESGIACPAGIYEEHVSGTYEGSVFIGDA